jgi:hypothetical protein
VLASFLLSETVLFPAGVAFFFASSTPHFALQQESCGECGPSVFAAGAFCFVPKLHLRGCVLLETGKLPEHFGTCSHASIVVVLASRSSVNQTLFPPLP